MLALLLTACGGSTQSTETTAGQPTKSEGRQPISVPMTYSVREGDAERVIHTPMMESQVGNERVLFILDTGATDPIFTMDLAKRIGAETTRVEDGTDHAGASVPTFAGDAPLRFSFGGFEQVVEEPLYIVGPPPFEGWNVCGIVSPQLLGKGAWVEMNFASNTLRLRDQLDAGGVALQRVPANGDEARLLIVEAYVGGSDDAQKKPLRLMLNTGGRHTELSPKVAPIETAATTATGRGVSGKAVEGAFFEADLLIMLGDASISVPKSVVRLQSPAYDAQLGIDAFAGATVAFRAEPSSPVYWWPPTK